VALTETDIACVRRQLDQATENFATRGMDETGIGHLQEAVRLLEAIHRAARQEPPARAIAPAIRELETRAALLAQLSDSAAEFYRGWFGTSPMAAEDYTPEGVWAAPQPSIGARGLTLEA
jgi:hypothetical protein